MNVVLVEPEIPHNTGAIGRLCLATDSTLHLVKPLGFSLEEKAVRRAGLDYWKEVKLELWESFHELEKAFPEANFWFFTTKTERLYTEVRYQAGDFLVFGPETRGLEKDLLAAREESCVTLPMAKGHTSIRSLNLATAAAVGIYEVLRQTG